MGNVDQDPKLGQKNIRWLTKNGRGENFGITGLDQCRVAWEFKDRHG
jgi:hypothetical protein